MFTTLSCLWRKILWTSNYRLCFYMFVLLNGVADLDIRCKNTLKARRLLAYHHRSFQTGSFRPMSSSNTARPCGARRAHSIFRINSTTNLKFVMCSWTMTLLMFTYAILAKNNSKIYAVCFCFIWTQFIASLTLIYLDRVNTCIGTLYILQAYVYLNSI